jgi:hypothetical protein
LVFELNRHRHSADSKRTMPRSSKSSPPTQTRSPPPTRRLSVADGRVTVGIVEEIDGSSRSTVNGIEIGRFRTLRQAAAAFSGGAP